MKPVSPVFPGIELPEVIFAKDQPEYLALPSVKTHDGKVTTRWRLSWSERLRVLFSGNMWLTILTFNKSLQPVRLTTRSPFERMKWQARGCEVPVVDYQDRRPPKPMRQPTNTDPVGPNAA